MARISLPAHPKHLIIGEGISASTHEIAVGFEAIVLSQVDMYGAHKFSGFYLGGEDFSRLGTKKTNACQIHNRAEWFKDWEKRVGSNEKAKPSDLSTFLDMQTRRSLLTSHLLCLFENEPMSLAPLNIEEDVIAKTVRQYLDLMAWTETSAATVLALQEGVSVATVHNRLRLARERDILEKPGSGKRTFTS
jgi:hypothetical protein